MTEEARWYVVHTYSGYENKVKEDLTKTVENLGLHDMIQDIMFPVEEVIEVKDGKRKRIQRKVYPGYVMIKMIQTPEIWYVVRNTRGVTGFVGADSSNPTPLTDEEVVQMGVERLNIKLDVEVGETVEIISGPFDGFTGKVLSLDDKAQKAKIDIVIFGRNTPTDLDYAAIRKMK